MPALDKIQVRRGTAAEWTSVNPVLSAGEFGYETGTGKVKIGDGITAWSSLGYITGGGSGAIWGAITGTLSAQTDLNTALNGKQDTLVSGTNIKTVNGTTLLGSGNISAGTVTSVAASVPSFLSISGSPVTTTGTLAISYSGTALPVANGGTGLTALTSGGVLAATGTTTVTSSGVLTSGELVRGGGAGGVPSTTGNATVTGTLNVSAGIVGQQLNLTSFGVKSPNSSMDQNFTGYVTANFGIFGFTASANSSATPDVYLSRGAAATFQLGAANAASPVAQTLQAQGSRGGTDSNVGGANLTIRSGAGTGTGTASSLIIQAPSLAASGTTQQTQTEVARFSALTTTLNNKVLAGGVDLGANRLNVFGAGPGVVAAIQANAAVSGDALVSLVSNVVTGSLVAISASISTSADLSFRVQQNGNGNAVWDLLILGTGDALTRYAVNGGQSWSLGLDNSDSDKFKISSSGSLGSNDRFVIQSTGEVGIGTSSPNASAALDVSSTTKAFMPPRMTNAQMLAIASPTAGMVVYDSTNNKLCCYDSANWIAMW